MKRRPMPPLTPRGPYTEWFWPTPPTSDGRKGFTSFEHTLVPEVDPGPWATYFGAHQFRLEGGEGGYLGLQTRGNRVDGSLGKMAIFSLWDATGADRAGGVGPGGVTPFGGEGSGWSARIPYGWAPERQYRLRVAETGVSPEGAWWTASVLDVDEGVESQIGRLRAAPGWGRLATWSVMWTEYYGPPLRRCSEMAHVSARFGTPIADGHLSPARTSSHLGDGTCDTTRVIVLDAGVRQEMGP